MSTFNKKDLQMYFIMGTVNVESGQFFSVLQEALESGITMFQLREKGEGCLKGKAYIDLAKRCQEMCNMYKVPFIINDDVQLVTMLDADGVHVGQEDLHIEEVKKLLQNKIVGVSVHNEAELHEAVQFGADYVGIGPIFTTNSKADAKQPAGTGFLKQARMTYTNYPMVAIGGIQVSNVYEVLLSGANGIAVISAVSQAKDVRAIIQQFKSVMSIYI